MDLSYQDIYKASELRTDIEDIVSLCQIGNIDLIQKKWNKTVVGIIDLCHRYAEYDVAKAQDLADTASEVAGELGDPCRVQAVIKRKLLPAIEEYLYQFADIDIAEEKWIIRGTSTGYLTLVESDTGRYVHSSYDPMLEAETLAERLYDPGMGDFFIFGCGLGYLPYQLWKRSMGSMRIHVYEDETILSYAELFGPLYLIPEDKRVLNAISQPDDILDEYVRIADENRGFDNLYVSDLYRRMILHKYSDNPFLCVPADMTQLSAKRNWEINAACNIRNTSGYYKDYGNNDFKDEWVVVAAGPSLDENIGFIKESLGSRTVIAVNRCVPKFAELGLQPDIYIVVDPYEAIYDHIKGYEDSTADSLLLADDCSYWGFVEGFKGPKYLIHTFYNGTSDIIKDYDLPEWNTGGTVASAAIEAACLMGASKIYVIGVDLSYPFGVRYGMSEEKIDDQDTYLEVRSNSGQSVLTSVSFISFGNQIREQIKRHKDIRIHNLSQHGMYIPGMWTGKWWEKGIDETTDINEWLGALAEDGFLIWNEKYYLLRQLVDRPGFNSEEVSSAVDKVLGQICDMVFIERPVAEGLRIKSGTDLNVILISDVSYFKEAGNAEGLKRALNRGNVLVINTQERLSGEEVCIEDPLQKIPSDISDDADSIECFGKKYPYYQIPAAGPAIDFYLELLQFLSGQKSVWITKTDPYSLFGLMCDRLLQ